MAKKSKQTAIPKRQVDVYFDQYAVSHQHPVNKLIHWICVPLIVFSILGLVWAIPFPSIGFLKQYGYDTFLNWASFLIAAVVYYYLRLSATLSYAMLFTVGVFAFFIVQLEHWQASGGPAVWQVCLVIFILSWIGQFIGHKLEGRKPSFFDDLKFLLIGPIWLWHVILIKLKIPY